MVVLDTDILTGKVEAHCEVFGGEGGVCVARLDELIDRGCLLCLSFS